MRIDLHCHTIATKQGELKTRNVSAVNFKKSVNSANVKLIAITNHNYFDYNQYKEFVKEVNNDFMIWPGIELDVIGSEEDDGHVIIINNPLEVEKFNKKISEILNGKKPDDFKIELKDLITLINSLDCIATAHYFKPHHLSEKSLQLIYDGINDKYRFFYEASNYKSMGILINHDYRGIVGSDVKNWDEYDKLKFPNLKLEVESFPQFLMLSKKDTAMVETLLSKKTKSKINIAYNVGETEIINIYDDTNIIFGTKGTGKSKALEKIKEFYKSKGIQAVYYTPSETDDKINSKLTVTANERELKSYDLCNYADEFKLIVDWQEEKITSFKDYMDYIKDLNENKNREKMLLLKADIIQNNPRDELNNNISELKIIDEIILNYDKLKLSEYLNKEELEDLKQINSKIRNKIIVNIDEFWSKYLSISLTNKCISAYKKIVERNTELKSKPDDSSFYKYCINRFALEINIRKINEGFNFKIVDKIDFVGLLEENKELNKIRKCKMLDADSKTNEFAKKITVLRETREYINDIAINIDNVSVVEVIEKFKESIEINKITSLDDFLGVIKVFQINGKEYTPSTGEATMIILQEKLNADVDVFLLDEPEKSLGNTYINDVVVPKINELSSIRKTVVIATHNANIAVRTFPYTSIYKEYKDSEYNTYLGNPFSNCLINLQDSSLKKSWKEESMRVLEGGKEAFEERGEIYE